MSVNQMQQMFITPYHNALQGADSIESLTEWVTQMFPDNYDEINQQLIQIENLEDAKNAIEQHLLAAFGVNDTSTPWNTAGFVGQNQLEDGKIVVAVIVSNGPNNFEHVITQELAYGIFLGLYGQEGWELSINSITVTPELFSDVTGQYSVTFEDREITFDTPDFLQGIITAGNWTGRDPQTIVTNFHQITESGNVPMTF